MRAWFWHGVALAAAALVFILAIATELGNPGLTRAQLLMTFWPRYIGAVLLLAVAVGAELVATEPQKG